MKKKRIPGLNIHDYIDGYSNCVINYTLDAKCKNCEMLKQELDIKNSKLEEIRKIVEELL